MMPIPPKVGNAWPEEGGVFVGTRIVDGAERHVVVADVADLYASCDTVQAEITALGTINGKPGWKAPDLRDLMLAYVNASYLFDEAAWYLSETEASGGTVWGLRFEDGLTGGWDKSDVLKMRPIRLVAA